MPENDAQLELKKRARRRLVGAAALAMAAAIILPVVMDKEPRPSGNELQIRIPSQEGGNYASRLITARPEPTEATSAPQVEQPAPPAVTAPPVAVPLPPPEPATSSPVATPVPPPVERTPSKPAAPVAKPVEADRAMAILEGKETASATATASAPNASAFYVQLGVYREQENVRSVQAKAKNVGYGSSTEKVGDRTRVRVGPFKTRAAADAAVAKLKKAGLAAVVAPVR